MLNNSKWDRHPLKIKLCLGLHKVCKILHICGKFPLWQLYFLLGSIAFFLEIAYQGHRDTTRHFVYCFCVYMLHISLITLPSTLSLTLYSTHSPSPLLSTPYIPLHPLHHPPLPALPIQSPLLTLQCMTSK